MRPGSKAWTQADDALLRTMIRQGISTNSMAALLSRTERAVYNRINHKRLIVRQNRRSGMTDAQFRMNLRRLGISREGRRDEHGKFSKSAVLTAR
jgi:hypothetical protein